MNEQIERPWRSHDPDDVAGRNIDIGGLLRKVNGVADAVTPASLFLDSSCTDSALVISATAYDEDSTRVSFRITGGTKTAKALDGDDVMRLGYRIVCRVLLVDGRHYDQSFWQDIADH